MEPIRRRFKRIASGVLWTCAALAMFALPAAGAYRISGYDPDDPCPGARVSILGSDFGTDAADVKYGRAGNRTPIGTLARPSGSDWHDTRIDVALPSGITPGDYWLAIYKNRTRKSSNEPTLTVRDCTGSGSGGTGGFRPRFPGFSSHTDRLGPRGSTGQMGEVQEREVTGLLHAARHSQDLAIVGVYPPLGSEVPVRDGHVDVRVEVRNFGSEAMEVRVTSPNSRAPNHWLWISEPLRVPANGRAQTTVQMGANVREGEIRSAVSLGTLRTPISYDDANRDNNVMQVRYRPVATQYQVTARIERVRIHDSCDSISEGEWQFAFHGGAQGASGDPIEEGVGIPGGGRTISVDAGRVLRGGQEFRMTRVAPDSPVTIHLTAVDCDGDTTLWFTNAFNLDYLGTKYTGGCSIFKEDFGELSGEHDVAGTVTFNLPPETWKSGGEFSGRSAGHPGGQGVGSCGGGAFDADITVVSAPFYH